MFRDKKMLCLFLLPGLTGLLVFFLVPFIGGVYYSLTDGSINNAFVGIDNYVKVLNNEMFRLGLKNTMELSLISAPLIWIFSFVVAVMLRSLGGKSAFFRNAMLIPYLMPSSALLLIWMLAFDYGGVINRIFAMFGLERVLWMKDAGLRFPIILMYVWKNLGFSMVIFTAALQAVPDAYYEYASLEGASPIKRELAITLPLVSPTAFLVFVLAWINAFKIFKEVYFMGGAYPDDAVYTLQHFINNQFSKLNYQYVTTSAYIFALIVIVLFAILYFFEARMRRAIG